MDRRRGKLSGMPRESQLEARFRKKVTTDLGGASYKLAPIDAGIPDRLVLLPGGRVELVELKAEGGKLRRVQEVWHDRAAKLGTPVTVLAGKAEIDAWVADRRG